MTCDSCLNKYGCREARFGESVRCMRFKDETEWFHLPCKVGTPVFFLRDKNIIETNVEKIIFTVLADFDKKYVNNHTILADFDKKREVLK